MAHDEKPILLPVSIISPTDIARLTREIESIDNFFREQGIRQAGNPVSMPQMSKLMDQLAADNQLNLLVDSDRSQIVNVLESLHQSAPVLHISFSVDPPGAYVQKIVTWLRRNIHQHALVTVGLQPNIGAGCVVRTTNRMFDFSLREFFAQKRDFFIEKMHAAIAEQEVLEAEQQQVDASEKEVQALVESNVIPVAPENVVETPKAAEETATENTTEEEATVIPVKVVSQAPTEAKTP